MDVRKIIYIDAFINLILGILLLLTIPFSDILTQTFGVPPIDSAFYTSIMGGIFIGISSALFLNHHFSSHEHLNGLGLGGAVSINLCGGFVLLGWLIVGNLILPTKGFIFLWSIALILIILSTMELITLFTTSGRKK